MIDTPLTLLKDLRETAAWFCSAIEIDCYMKVPSTGKYADGEDYEDRAIALLETRGWQPIETAPKDGTPVLLTGGELGEDIGVRQDPRVIARWVPLAPPGLRQEDLTIPIEQLEHGWIYAWFDSGYGWITYHNPTHWQPLPEPPRSK
jgi:hypothetical protein